jgi:Tfp pilus assembly protein FimV
MKCISIAAAAALAAHAQTAAQVAAPVTDAQAPQKTLNNDEKFTGIKPIMTKEMLAGTQPMLGDRKPVHILADKKPRYDKRPIHIEQTNEIGAAEMSFDKPKQWPHTGHVAAKSAARGDRAALA